MFDDDDHAVTTSAIPGHRVTGLLDEGTGTRDRNYRSGIVTAAHLQLV